VRVESWLLPLNHSVTPIRFRQPEHRTAISPQAREEGRELGILTEKGISEVHEAAGVLLLSRFDHDEVSPGRGTLRQ